MCKRLKVQRDNILLREMVHDSNFKPYRTDKILECWANKGLKLYIQLFNNNSIEPHETLMSRYGLEQKQFFNYLQVRSYVNQNKQGKLDNYILRCIAENRSKNIKLANIYSILLNVTKMETKIKEQWGKESSIDIPDEEWRESLK